MAPDRGALSGVGRRNGGDGIPEDSGCGMEFNDPLGATLRGPGPVQWTVLPAGVSRVARVAKTHLPNAEGSSVLT